jgi:predicted transcriptional regulator
MMKMRPPPEAMAGRGKEKDMLDNDSIREILKKRKAEMEIPWRVIAERAGISLSTLAKYIYGDNAMRTELLIYVLEAVGLELIIREKRGE